MEIVDVNGTYLHYRLSGPANAPILVFSNSLGTDFRIWDDVVAALANAYRILRYDTRGHGLSDCPTANWGMQDNVDDLAALMDHLGLAHAAVTGLSVGGLIAQGLAAERPDLVRLLIVSNTGVKVSAPNVWQDRIRQVQQHGLASISDMVMQRWFTPEFLRTSAKVSLLRNMLLATRATGYTRTCQAIADTDLFDSTARLRLPSLVIAGEKDTAAPPDVVRETAGLIAGCRFEIIRGSGHLPCIDNPDRVAALLTDFLAVNGHS